MSLSPVIPLRLRPSSHGALSQSGRAEILNSEFGDGLLDDEIDQGPRRG